MKIEEAIEILERKTTIPGDGYTWEQIEEAFSLAITALRSMQETTKPGWISVKERLPNFGIPVLICWDGYTDIAEYRCGMVCPKWRTQHYGTVDLASVTHWMPLPEPPEEG